MTTNSEARKRREEREANPHRLTLTLEDGRLTYGWSCSADVGAACRRECPEGCDEWADDHEHALVDSGRCIEIEWLENDDPDECHKGSTTVFDGPVDVAWGGNGYQFTLDADR